MKVASCQMNPPHVQRGQSSSLVITLDTPAPPGGQEVAIGTDINGSIDSIVSVQQGLGILQGTRSGSVQIQTTSGGDASSITFSAGVFGQYPQPTTTLEIY